MPSQTFTSSTTWVAPFSGVLDNAEAVGAGGAATDTDGTNGGAGGGGGEYAASSNITAPINVTLGTSYTVTVDTFGNQSFSQFVGDSAATVKAFSGKNAVTTTGGAGGTGGTGGVIAAGGAGGGGAASGGFATSEGGGGGGAGGPAGAGLAGGAGSFASPGSGGPGNAGSTPYALSGNGGWANGGGSVPTNYGGGQGGGGVTNPGVAAPGTNGVIALTWTLPTPNVTSVDIGGTNPPIGPTTGGTAVQIHGTGFSASCAATFDGMPPLGLTTTVVSDILITCNVPAHAAGAVDCTVTCLDTGASSSTAGGSGFTYLAPTISSITPIAGPNSGGTAVTITGSNFLSTTGDAIADTVGGVALTSFTVVNDTTITGFTGAHVGNGFVDVVVSNGADSSTLANGFVYFGGGGGGGRILRSSIIAGE